MITIICIIVFWSLFYWTKTWDKSLKTRTKIKDHLPELTPLTVYTIYVPTAITIWILFYLIFKYLP